MYLLMLPLVIIVYQEKALDFGEPVVINPSVQKPSLLASNEQLVSPVVSGQQQSFLLPG